jgi:hypothetical protein
MKKGPMRHALEFVDFPDDSKYSISIHVVQSTIGYYNLSPQGYAH